MTRYKTSSLFILVLSVYMIREGKAKKSRKLQCRIRWELNCWLLIEMGINYMKHVRCAMLSHFIHIRDLIKCAIRQIFITIEKNVKKWNIFPSLLIVINQKNLRREFIFKFYIINNSFMTAMMPWNWNPLQWTSKKAMWNE